MKERKDKTINNYKVSQNAELPNVSITITKSSADFIKEEINISSSGFDINEALTGFDFLINRIRIIKKMQGQKKKTEI
jgi:hypothetical protein